MEVNTLVNTKSKVFVSKLWNVIFHNDNKTTFEIVIEILMHYFNKSKQEAEILALRVHKEGKSVVASYTFEIAEQKAIESINFARKNRAPLEVTLEECL